ncbi:hypothetical protein [Sphingomicrobium sediminis]|uniref:Uncharacterized protein n=1 Tax=Sphingomicrobium sediminis TaxID=2950949 RepID=A0A9X2J4G4_9SPHN|nr:hypothetical protein [Sphingomicrobium sediminis]MCM8558341.1 hypothetical protein [Sphingomicrobium sediminis]
MITLLRRLRRNAGEIRGPEWLLLGIETIAVIAGILVAFQLQEWATDRREKAQLDRISDGLLEEARTAVALIWQDVEQRQPGIDQGIRVAQMLNAGQCPTQADLEGLRILEVYAGIDPPSGVYDELVAGAGLSALPSSTARLGIDFYRNARATYQFQLINFRDNRWPLLVPDDPDVSIAFDPESSSDMRVEFDLESLCNDQEFSDRFNYVLRNQHFFQRRYRMDLFENAAFMCVALADMQGEQCYDSWMRDVLDAETGALVEERGRARLEEADI